MIRQYALHACMHTVLHAYMDTIWSILYAHCFMFHLHNKFDSISFVFWYVIYRMLSSIRFNLQFEACGCKCEIRNLDADEYSYIVFIKKMKQCIANKNEKVELYPSRSIKVEARRLNEMGRFIIDSDEYMCHVFE